MRFQSNPERGGAVVVDAGVAEVGLADGAFAAWAGLRGAALLGIGRKSGRLRGETGAVRAGVVTGYAIATGGSGKLRYSFLHADVVFRRDVTTSQRRGRDVAGAEVRQRGEVFITGRRGGRGELEVARCCTDTCKHCFRKLKGCVSSRIAEIPPCPPRLRVTHDCTCRCSDAWPLGPT